MTPIQTRPRRPDDDQKIIALYNGLSGDTMPETVEEHRFWITSRPDGAGLEQWVVEQDRVVASLVLEEEWQAQQQGTWSLFMAVADAHARHGVGSRLYEHTLARASALGIQRLYTTIREDRPDSLAFAVRRGFTATGRVARESRLTVSEARLEGFDGVEQRLASEGIQIRTLAEIGMDDELFLRALHLMSEGTMQDVPHTEAVLPRPFAFWVENTLLFPGNAPAWCWVAQDLLPAGGRRPVGLARLRRQGNAAANAYTAVDPAYRGRGIARALKFRTVLWAQATGLEYLYTGNDRENRRMLDINSRLGYTPLPASVEMLKVLT